MKKFIVPACLYLVLVLLSSWDNPRDCMNFDLPVFTSSVEGNEQNITDQQKKSVYTCPMHSGIVQDKPGKCPKCGMEPAKKADPPKK